VEELIANDRLERLCGDVFGVGLGQLSAPPRESADGAPIVIKKLPPISRLAPQGEPLDQRVACLWKSHESYQREPARDITYGAFSAATPNRSSAFRSLADASGYQRDLEARRVSEGDGAIHTDYRAHGDHACLASRGRKSPDCVPL